MQNKLLEAAIKYAEKGWLVFPCQPKGKTPLTPNGFYDATTDPNTITHWWTKWPNANVAIRTGKESGISVLDIDPRNGGDYSIEEYEVPDTPYATTGGGGLHRFMMYNELLKTRSNVFPGVDIKNDGGYIIAAPSIHPSGQAYAMNDEDLPLAGVPEWLIKASNNGKAESFKLPDDEIPSGEQDNVMYKFACSLRAKNMPENLIRNALTVTMKDMCQPSGAPWTEKDVERWLDSSRKYAADQPPQQSKHSSFNFVHIGDIELKPPQWLIKGLFEEDSIVMFFGDPGSGKSFASIDMVSCIATGKSFHGRRVEKGAAFYIGGEGQNGIKRRFKAWEIDSGIEVLKEHPIFISQQSASLTNEESVTEVVEKIDAVVNETGVIPKIVAIDTLARNFGAGNENDTSDMNKFIRGLDIIRAKYRCAVVIFHHCGLSDKSRGRGASPLRGALDSEYKLWKDAQGIVRLEPTKTKEFEDTEPMSFTIETVDLGLVDEYLEPITSAVLKSVKYEKAKTVSKGSLGSKEDQALATLKEMYKQREGTLEEGGFPASNALVTFEEWKEACTEPNSSDRKNFKRTCDSLIFKGLIKMEGCHVFPLLF